MAIVLKDGRYVYVPDSLVSDNTSFSRPTTSATREAITETNKRTGKKLTSVEAQLNRKRRVNASISADNRSESQRKKSQENAKRQQERANEAQNYNAGLRFFGLSDLSTQEARDNPDLVESKMDDAKKNVGFTLASLYPLGRGLSLLRNSANPALRAAYHTINGGIAAASASDMYENGPSVSNVMGTVLPTMEYIPAIYNTAKNAYYINRAMRPQSLEVSEPILNVGWGPRQTINVSHTSNSSNPLSLFKLDR